MTLAFASYKDFKLFQMDIKSAFLNDFIEEKMYVEQPPKFVDPTHSVFVYKLLAQRPITLVLMMINSYSYCTNDLVFN